MKSNIEIEKLEHFAIYKIAQGNQYRLVRGVGTLNSNRHDRKRRGGVYQTLVPKRTQPLDPIINQLAKQYLKAKAKIVTPKLTELHNGI